MLDARSFFLADWKSLCSVAAAAAHTSENDGTIVLSQSAALTEDREINMCNPKMPRQLDAHLELENAEGNFCLFSSLSCTQMTQRMRGRTPGAAGGPIDTHQGFATQGVSVLSGWLVESPK